MLGLVVEEGAEVAGSAAAVLDEGAGDDAAGGWVDVAVGEDDEGAEELDAEVGADGAVAEEGALVSVVLDGDGEAVGAWVGAVADELVGDVVAEGEEAFVGAEVDVLGLVGVGAGDVEDVGDVAGEEEVGVEDVGAVEELDVGAEVVEGAGAAVGVVEDVGAVVPVGEVGEVAPEVGVDDWLACTP
ncbi:hypothetical protein ACLNGM_09790 [Aureimonas phyllosphaerae]|uniref:hypothetical protein n=1 Tax=Aureimonas phyllosphaerae TaxID=1166078 RepID=UPI003A5BF86D